MANTTPNNYSTKSLFLASYLYSVPDIEFIGSGRSENGNVYFNFSPKETVEKLVDSYYTDKVFNCNARALAESYKTLKDLIFEVKGSRRQRGEYLASGT